MKLLPAPLIAAFALLASACATPGTRLTPSLDGVISGAHRTPAYVERDRYRHPSETLRFFGLKPNQTVVEVWPGGGWYTEILAPYLRPLGKYYAAGFVTSDKDASEYYRKGAASFRAKLDASPGLYDQVTVTELGGPSFWTAAPAGSADLVLTFRNVHNWMNADSEVPMFKAFYAALKHGGVLGVVEHRAAPGTSREDMIESGYVTEDYVMELAAKAGFKLLDRSQINANPSDSKDHPEGVWTLPPSLRLGDKDRAKYLAIGESDRMTLKFIKPLLIAEPPTN